MINDHYGTQMSNRVGAVRYLSYNANIKDTRGFLDTNNASNGSTDINSIAEMLTPFVTTFDDPPRQSMMSTQSRHTVPLNHADAPLFGTGAEKSVINNLPDGFVVKAKQDGKVKKYDRANNILILEYKDGTKDVIDLDSVITHNSAGGFYENLKYDVLFAEGRKFSKNEVVAKVSDYFKGEKNGELIYSMGHLTKTALTGLDQNYEDSTVITSNLSKSLATNVTMNKTVVLGTSANVSFIAKKGQSIKTGDPLLVFENSFNDDSISNVLNKAGDEFKQTIQEFGNKIVKSHYTGKVVDVKIYRNREIEEFSDSLQKLIKSYENKYAKKEKTIAKEVDPQNQNLYSNNTPPLGVIDSDKIKGRDVEGIMIEFYVQYEDFMAVGDKLTAYTALKAVVANVIPEREAPYSDYRPDEHVQLLFSPLSIVSRMTQSIYYDMYLNKGLIELKRQIAESLGMKPRLIE